MMKSSCPCVDSNIPGVTFALPIYSMTNPFLYTLARALASSAWFIKRNHRADNRMPNARSAEKERVVMNVHHDNVTSLSYIL